MGFRISMGSTRAVHFTYTRVPATARGQPLLLPNQVVGEQPNSKTCNWWEYAKFSIQTMCRMKRKKVEMKYATVAPRRVDNVTQTELKQKE